jgi:hypothetical protein
MASANFDGKRDLGIMRVRMVLGCSCVKVLRLVPDGVCENEAHLNLTSPVNALDHNRTVRTPKLHRASASAAWAGSADVNSADAKLFLRLGRHEHMNTLTH